MSRFPFHLNPLIYLSASILTLVLSLIFPSWIWAVFAFLIFAGFALNLSRIAPATFLIMSPLIFLRITEFASGIAIESGAYIEEITVFGSPTGAFNRLATLYIVFFTVSAMAVEPVWATFKVHFKHLEENGFSNVIYIGTIAASALSCLYMLTLGAKNGFPLFEGIDRFAYRRQSSVLLTTLLNNRTIIAVVLGLLFIKKSRRMAVSLCLVLLIIVSILFSEKFTSLSLMIIFFLMPSGLLHIARDRAIPLLHIAKFGLVVTVLTIPIVLLVYGFLVDPEAAIERFLSRATAQGELWWVADKHFLAAFKFESATLIADIKSWYNPVLQSPTNTNGMFGLYYVMDEFAPQAITFYAEEQGTGYIFSLFPYLLMTTGLFGVLVLGTILHLYYALVSAAVFAYASNGRIIETLICMKLVIFILFGGFIVGYLWFFFGYKPFILIAALVGMHLLRRISRAKQKLPQKTST